MGGSGSCEPGHLASYRSNGFVLLRGLLAREVTTALVALLKTDFARQRIAMSNLEQSSPLLARPATEIYGFHYVPLASFHWGMTPSIEAVLGESLLPTYCYFRLYRAGDICRVHGDRPACEHSLSLTMASSDNLDWPLEVAQRRTDVPYQRADDNFAMDELRGSATMEPGDGVLYQGVHHHHARTSPNPNRWSAHLFLHWVARNGPYADQAFDGKNPPAKVEF